MLIGDIREIAYQACQRNENILSPAFFDQHLAVVAHCAKQLAGSLGADPELVELAAYLHDLSAVYDPTTMPDHANLSADVATRILLERGYPQDHISKIARSIASHSNPLPVGRASPEEVCLSNADAVARILRPAYWLYFAFAVRKCSFEEGRQWLRSLVEGQWDVLVDPAKEFVGSQYAMTLELLAK